MVLPASVRAELGLEPGAQVLLSTEDDGSVRLRPYRSVAAKSRGRYAKGGKLVDELRRDRRADAERED
jgi:AbrB family looped-hinge helix DNA binding protein